MDRFLRRKSTIHEVTRTNTNEIFTYVVAAWLLLIIGNLLLIPGYFDVALRDVGLMLGALALGRLSSAFQK